MAGQTVNESVTIGGTTYYNDGTAIEKKKELADYRQELRDAPMAADWPLEYTFPEKPKGGLAYDSRDADSQHGD